MSDLKNQPKEEPKETQPIIINKIYHPNSKTNPIPYTLYYYPPTELTPVILVLKEDDAQDPVFVEKKDQDEPDRLELPSDSINNFDTNSPVVYSFKGPNDFIDDGD